jgi:hypothetical protein
LTDLLAAASTLHVQSNLTCLFTFYFWCALLQKHIFLYGLALFSWAQHVCHAIGIMMCNIQPSLRTCSVNWFVCIGFIFSVDEVNVARATLRKMQWMDLASKVLVPNCGSHFSCWCSSQHYHSLLFFGSMLVHCMILLFSWMQTIAERPSTKVIQYLLNESTRFALIMLRNLNQWIELVWKFSVWVVSPWLNVCMDGAVH